MSKTMISIFAALLLAVMGTTGCNKSKLEKAHKAAATISRVLTIAGTVIEQLGREQLLDDQEALKLSDAVNDLKRAVLNSMPPPRDFKKRRNQRRNSSRPCPKSPGKSRRCTRTASCTLKTRKRNKD